MRLKASPALKGLRAAGLNPTEAQLKSFGFSDKPEHRIGFEQFLPMFTSLPTIRTGATWQDFVEGFSCFDAEGNGLLRCSHIRHILTTLGDKMTDSDVTALFDEQQDENDYLNCKLFVKKVMAG